MALPRRLAGFAVLALSGSAGALLITDAALRGGLLRYQLAGYVVGGLLCAPVLVAVVGGTPGRRFLRRALFASIPTLALLLLLEPVLRLTGIGAGDDVQIVADERLGHRLEPGHGGADERGWRNVRALDTADVVCIGDSQTYGFGVRADASYAQQVAAVTGLRVYSMALGGYGPVQYRELGHRALALRPKAVVVGFYFGNDLLDAFLFAHLPVAADWRRPDVEYPRHRAVDADDGPAPNFAVGAIEGLTRWSRIAGMGARAVREGLRGAGGIWDAEPGVPQFDGGPIATLFTPGYRLPALDPARAPVAEGLWITSQCLRELGAECRAAGVRCLFLPIHTKEYVYQQMLVADGRGRGDLAPLFEVEASIATAVLDAARAAGLDVIDPTDRLVGALRARCAVWPAGSDGHLNAAGHAELAHALAAALGESGIRPR